MSFILDAVKKSEQDRRFAHAEPLQSWHYPGPTQKPRQQFWIAGLVILNTLVLGCLVIWMFQPQWFVNIVSEMTGKMDSHVLKEQTVQVEEQDTLELETALLETVAQQSRTAVKPDSALAASVAMVPTTVDEQDIIRPGQSYEASNQALDEIITPTPRGEQRAYQASATVSELSDVVDLEALPESLVIHIPAIAFSSHIYSSEPQVRQVVVNGQKLREGDYLNRDLQLLEIEEKSVVFQQFQTPFRVLLARYWVRSE